MPLGVSDLGGGQVGFAVWAPHATGVSVAGEFNDWNFSAAPLERDGDVWSGAYSAVEGDEYKFRLQTEHGELDRIDPYAREVTNSVGAGLIRFRSQARDGFTPPPRSAMVIYELHIGTFAGVDGIGTYDDAIERLDALADLGVNAIEVMPTAEFAGDQSWGYNPAHPFAVESAYGGPDALRRFVAAAHERGMAVIIDVVFNHFGPSDLDLWRFDGWGVGDYGGIYFFNDERASTPWGNTRPDYGRREVRDYIVANACYWVEEFGADGLRFDMTLYMRSIDAGNERPIPEGWSLTQQVNDAVQAVGERLGKPLLTIAEDLQDESRLTQPVASGGAGFGAQWSAEFVHPVRHLLISPSDDDRSPSAYARTLQFRYGDDPFARVIYTESHDEVANGRARIPTEINPDDATGDYAASRAAFGLMLMMTTPGIPMLFQGQERLRDLWFQDSRPLDWTLTERNVGFVQLATDLIRLRTGRDDRANGLAGNSVAVLHIDEAAGVMAWHRWDRGGVGDDTLVVANFRNAPVSGYRIGLPVDGDWQVVFNGDADRYGPQFDGHEVADLEVEAIEWDGKPRSAEVSVAPYSVTIYARSMP